MAAYLLKDALKADPNDHYLQHHLARVNDILHSGQKPKTYRPPVFLAFLHEISPRLFYLTTFLSPLVFIAVATNFYERSCDSQGQAGSAPNIFLLLAIGAFFMLLYACVAHRLFLFTWFKYLAAIPPIHALLADKAADSSFRVHRLGSTYNQLRKAFFASRYGQ